MHRNILFALVALIASGTDAYASNGCSRYAAFLPLSKVPAAQAFCKSRVPVSTRTLTITQPTSTSTTTTTSTLTVTDTVTSPTIVSTQTISTVTGTTTVTSIDSVLSTASTTTTITSTSTSTVFTATMDFTPGGRKRDASPAQTPDLLRSFRGQRLACISTVCSCIVTTPTATIRKRPSTTVTSTKTETSNALVTAFSSGTSTTVVSVLATTSTTILTNVVVTTTTVSSSTVTVTTVSTTSMCPSSVPKACNNNSCKVLESDPENCGSCNNRCPVGTTCSGGQCVSTTCKAGTSCGSGDSCVCFTNTEGTGTCSANAVGCPGSCGSSSDCPAGSSCSTFGCCIEVRGIQSCANPNTPDRLLRKRGAKLLYIDENGREVLG